MHFIFNRSVLWIQGVPQGTPWSLTRAIHENAKNVRANYMNVKLFVADRRTPRLDNHAKRIYDKQVPRDARPLFPASV